MNQGKYVFSQLMGLISHNDFNSCVRKYKGDYKVKDFSCWKQFLCMAFGQLTHRDSLSDTILCLNALKSRLFHLGIGKPIPRSTLSRANENRDWRIYEEFALLLIAQARKLYANDSQLEVDLKENVFAIDATAIEVSLSVFPWATYKRFTGAVKLHTQLDLKTAIPEFIAITPASFNEMKALDLISYQAGSFYVMDRGYVDLDRLYNIHQQKAYFIIRPKHNQKMRRLYSAAVDKASGVRYDQIIRFENFYASKHYPEKLRRIKFYDKEQDRLFTFITNNTDLKAHEIAQLYKHRWIIELFFKWIKQHLKIKAFWGYSPNAVKTQIWIAISVYVLVAIAKKKFTLNQSLYEILQILSISILDKIPVNQLFKSSKIQNQDQAHYNQLNIFEL